MLFQALKFVMTTVPMLVIPDFTQPFVVEIDVSATGIRVVLMQEGPPISFISQALTPKGKSKSVYKCELMAIVLALQKWRHYLLGKQFIVCTDQKNLKHLIEQKNISGDQQCQVIKVSGYDFEIQYRLGVENKTTDALYWQSTDSVTLFIISTSQWLRVILLLRRFIQMDIIRRLFRDDYVVLPFMQIIH